MIGELALAAQLVANGVGRAEIPMRPASSTASPGSQSADSKGDGTPPVPRRRRRRSGMALWKLFR